MPHKLTNSQLAIYYESINKAGQPVYLLPVLLKLEPGVDLQRLAAAVGRAVAKFPILGMVLQKDDEGMPYLTAGGKQATCRIVDITDADLERIANELPEPFDLDGGPLFEAVIYRTSSRAALLLKYHHIISDGSTVGILNRAIADEYLGEGSKTPTMTIFDVQAAEEALRNSPRYNEAKKWYLDTFSGIDSDSTPLPDILSQGQSQSQGQLDTLCQLVIPLKADYTRLFEFSRSINVPLSMVANGAFGYTMGVWGANDESIFTTIFAGRPTPEHRLVAGMMVKTLPVYCRWEKDTTAADYLQELAHQYKTAKEYSDTYSFAEICAATGLQPRLSFAYRGSIQAENIVIPGLCHGSKRIGRYTTGDTMQFMLDHIGDGLVMRVEYQGSQYTEAFITSIVDAYDMVLQGIAEKKYLSEIELCSTEMLAKLEAFNTVVAKEPVTETVVDRFLQHVANNPGNPILKTDTVCLNYGEVAETAQKLARYINSLGIGRGDAVAVMVDRNQWMISATMGVLMSGAAYQPLDASYPAERLNYMMRDAEVRLLIADRHLELALEDDLAAKIKILYTDEIPSLQVAKDVKPTLPTPDDTFVLLYTSGTTGVPKGVRLTHGNLMALVRSTADRIPAQMSKTWGMYASYGFDAGYYSTLTPIASGGAVAVVPEDIRLDIEAINEFCKRHDVRMLFMTTQVGRIFATTIEDTTVEVLSLGGEKLTPCEPPKNYLIQNLYGPTECTTYTHGTMVDRLYSRVPIGMHNDDVKNYIVDKVGRRMPLGALGELVVAGPQVGNGYLHLPEKSAQVFVDNPFSDDPLYAKMYRTGDIVRLLPANGEADIIGRSDGQVKIRGFRIELAEVEAVVREFPGITDATVQAFDNPTGGKFIAAYIVGDSAINVNALNEFISERKPPYMVPQVTMQIEAIPLTQNQKVNKRALPEPVLQEAAPEVEDTRKPNILEKAICDIVADVLKVDNVPLSTPLSYLGLTSISSIRLASALYKRFGVTLKGADLVKGTTVVDIEDAILSNLLSGGAAPKQEAKVEHPETCELTVSQQGVFADTMRSPESTAYNIPEYFIFDAATDTDALADALVRILDAHPYLRDAHLQMGEADIEQTVLPHRRDSISVKEMNDEEFAAYREQFIRPFDLMEAPLYRIEIVRTPTAVYLLMDVHHIVFDGSSLTVMLAQLKSLLEGGSIEAGQYSYLDYAVAEKQWLQGNPGQEASDYFKSLLSECEAASDIPSDMPQSNDPGERGIITRPVNMQLVEAYCRDNDITPAALYLAATCYATARFTSSHSAFISTISTGRSDVRFSDTFGMFVKTLPIALSIEDASAREYVHRAKVVLERSVGYEMYPYAKICADYNYAPNIVFEYQLGLVDDYTINGKCVERHLFDVDTLKFKIAVHIEEVNGQPSVAVHYRKGIYSERLMQALCDSISVVAQQIIADPEQNIRHLSMLTPEHKGVLERFAATEVVPPSDKCMHTLMEEQATLHPDRKAVVACDRTLTYAELDRLANVVANNLIAKGVKAGDKVVLLLSRTSCFFTSLYGVLKTGAAYIPSSPDYPEERKQSIIEDSNAAFIITDDNVEELHQGTNDRKPDVKVSPDDLVYLIYTSGSTGKPKGVLLRHRGIVNYITPGESMIHTQAIVERAKTVGSITTVAFDMAQKEWGIALSNGLTVVFAGDEESNDPVALAELFAKNEVDYFNTTPSRMQQYMDLDDFCRMLSNCKVIICGAEKYPEYLVSRLRLIAPAAEIFNTYGPTEITVSSNACNLTDRASVSVGRPLRNYIEHIVDQDDNLLPPGVIGELLIGGTNIAVGYNANPEQTAKAFIEFNGVPTYRSGDYARFDAEGNVIILGRKDTQVKLRGLRIELGEIERVLADIEGVAVSHIMIRNVAGRENLVAYYALRPGASLSTADIKAQMMLRLTDYMVPSFFVEMPQMPLTPNGKINTRALPEPAVAERAEGRAANGDLEIFFVDIFKSILGLEKVYADDSFFELGGTSLTATRIMIAASKAGHRIVYADIFANPTAEALARLIAEREGASTGDKSDNTAALQMDDYDYTVIDKLLSNNTLDSFRSGSRRALGNVLLTGATGFAGMHVLHELLTNYDVQVVCLGRDSRAGVPAAERINQLYFYYFGESLPLMYPGRVHVVKGDITKIDKDTDFVSDIDFDIDTVINCAANVKHFSAGTDIEDINYYGVLNLIEWCKAHGAALVQTSTVSVTGRQPADKDNVLSEQDLYIGQNFSDNKYITSKFMAERAVLQATANGEIVGKVVRLGNLAPREQDGEFQINFHTNGFMNRLKSIVLVGCYPYAMYEQNKDISPIDDVARAIVLFAQTPDACVLFHGNNANRYSLGNFYYEASRTGLDIHPVETEEYQAALEEAKNDPEKLGALVGLMAYEGMGDGLKPVDYSNHYSDQVLLRMGFHWPVVSPTYVTNLVRALDGLGFFSI